MLNKGIAQYLNDRNLKTPNGKAYYVNLFWATLKKYRDRIPDEKTIEKLEKRNQELSKLIHRGDFKSKDTEELHLSID